MLPPNMNLMHVELIIEIQARKSQLIIFTNELTKSKHCNLYRVYMYVYLLSAFKTKPKCILNTETQAMSTTY